MKKFPADCLLFVWPPAKRKLMRRFIFVVPILLLMLLISMPLAAKKKDPLAGLSPAEEAGARLLAMQGRGLIQLSISEPSTFLLVEPLGWKGLKHVEKKKLARLALTFCRGLNQKGKNILFVILQDMTSRKTLGKAFVKSGRIEIYR